MFFGLAPAIQSTRVGLTSALKESRINQGRRRYTFLNVNLLNVNLGHVFVVSQVSISLLILVRPVLFVRTASRTWNPSGSGSIVKTYCCLN